VCRIPVWSGASTRTATSYETFRALGHDTGSRRCSLEWLARTIQILLALLSVCGALAAGLSGGSSAAVRRTTRTALVRGSVQVRGSDGGYEDTTFVSCTPSQGCVTSDRVAAVNAAGRRAVTVWLHHARFKLNLAPGRYTLKLLGDGKHVHGQVMQSRSALVRAHRTTTVRFRFDVP
jgi:hypothetical protein